MVQSIKALMRTSSQFRGAVWAVAVGVTLGMIGWLSAWTLEEVQFEQSIRVRVPALEGRVQTIEDTQSEKYDQIIDMLNEARRERRMLSEKLDRKEKEK